MWEKVKEVFQQKFNKVVQLNEKNILLGVTDIAQLTVEEKIFLNHLILIAKMCIGKYKYGTPINLSIMFDQELVLRHMIKF